MKTVAAIIFQLCLIPAIFCSEMPLSPPQISREMHGKKIEITGYMYLSKEGKPILAFQPNLKSCCVGAQEQAEKQMIIKGLEITAQTHQPVTLQGTFFIDEASGQMTLIDAKRVIKGSSLFTSLASIAAVAALIFLFRKRY